ncbi:MAG: CDP-alcohol phosphatidyltransferase family protein [Pseudomonadota bacterium]
MDYFNFEERASQRDFAGIRDRIFSPVTNLLVRLGVRPNQVSAAGVGFLVLAGLTPPSLAWLAILGMAMYVLCDGLDGPLARRTGTPHPGGLLVDIVADQLGVVILPAAAIYHFGAWGPAMVLFAAAYVAFIGLVVYANVLRVELRRFIRSKYAFFLLYLASLYFNRDLVSYFCALFALYYSVETFETLRRIYAFHTARQAASPGDALPPHTRRDIP